MSLTAYGEMRHVGQNHTGVVGITASGGFFKGKEAVEGTPIKREM
jgi:hypothetical protein